MGTFKTLQVQELPQLMTEAQLIILDCRALKDYRAGHLDNALHVHEQLRDTLLRKGDKQRALLIYCYHGHSSEHLAQVFCDFGFQHVYSLAGGYAAWQAQQP